MNKNMSKKQLIITGVVVLVAIGLGFYGGVQYGKNSVSAMRGGGAYQRAGSFNGNRLQLGGSQGGFSSGQIISKDAGTITIKLNSGSTALVLLSASTSVNKFASGTLDDLAVGNQVMITGDKNSDGSLNAKSIQIQPEMAKPQGQ